MDPAKKSAFLLTEIAMDLLSNKFYDVDGNQVRDMASLHNYKCDGNDYLPDTRNLRNILYISDVSLQAADNIKTEIIDLDEDEEPNKIKSEYKPEVNIENKTIELNKKTKDLNDYGKCDEHETETAIDLNDADSLSELLIFSENQEDRVSYLTESIKKELKKMKSESLSRRNDFILENIIIYDDNLQGHKPRKELSKVFYAREKKMLNVESEALLAFIKIVKEKEFSKESIETLNRISSDVLKAKEIIN